MKKDRLKKYKRLSKLQIVSLILLTIAFFLRIFKVHDDNSLYIFALVLSMFAFLKYMVRWSNEGKTWFKRIDKSYTKNFTRKPSDTLFFMVVAYFLEVAIVFLTDIFVDNYLSESLFSLYLLTIVCNYMGLVIVDKTSDDVIKFVDESGKGKIKIERKKKNG